MNLSNFTPKKGLKKLADKIVNSRREADLDKSKAVLALTNKLNGKFFILCKFTEQGKTL